ncbi:ABC transporter substrate-binding protein [Homoserinimonas sp. OAct 916]|uniref:peptide ABC transporter substrate-binding protein n=1 Tax=Homoserinimonas sp. OAct 916 TaxID=2211450 RepID=UPI000DBE8C47|nr:ABC transporter substrate-binding protein [Homoserinimonas sp. OAct 916]
MKISRIGLSAAALLSASALVLTGCASGDGGAPAPGTSDTPGASTSTGIVTANSNEPQNPLYPANTNEVGGGKILDMVFAGLYYYDADGKAIPEVAKSVESDDATNYTVKLNDGWTFTNGEKVTASSFVDAWQYGALLSNAQLSSYFFETIDGFSYDKDSKLALNVVDDLTFTVKLSAPEADWPLRLGYSAFMPLPTEALVDGKATTAFGENPIGNGPYMLASADAWQHNVQIDLVPNPDYKGTRTVKNGGVTLKFYDNQDSAYADLQSDNLDVLDAIPASAFETFEQTLGDRAINQPSAVFQSFTIPEKLEHFGGEEGKLRRAALSMAINRPEITDVIFFKTRTPASDYTSPVIAGWSDSLAGSDVLKFNADEAKAKWAEAEKISPYTGTFTIGYNSDGGHQPWVDAVANSLKNTLGIKAEGQPYATFAELRTDVTDRKIKGAFRTGWQADYPSMFNFLGPLYATNAGSNDGDYSSPEFDALLKEGASAKSVDDATGFFQKAQEVLLQDLPAIPLWYSNVTGGFSTQVQNVKFGWNSVPLYYEITKD